MNMKVKQLVCCVLCSATWVYAATTNNMVINSDFGDSSVSLGTFQYQTNDDFWATSWLFSDDSSGIANSSSAWGGEAATNTVAFLQGPGGVTQFISAAARYFTISFDLAQRGTFATGSVNVYFDNKLIAENLTPSTASFENYEYTLRSNSGTLHIVSFQGVHTDGVDSTVFLDNVSITAEY